MQRIHPIIVAVALASVLACPWASAVVNQVDGTVVPETARMQACLDNNEGVGVMSAIFDADIAPEVYLPPPGVTIHFVDMAEGAGYRNSFGWYNAGDDVSNPANLHTIFGCRSTASCDCPCPSTWWRHAYTDISDDSDYSGGFIGFWLRTPELLGGGSDGDNCGSATDTGNRIYFTEKILNDDGDYVHFLAYTSATHTDAFYFGFEDLFRGGDNDFEDMLIYVEGLVPDCIPRVEACNNSDDDCDTVVDDGLTRTCSTICGSGNETCTAGLWGACDAPIPTGEVCDGLDNDCDGETDEGLTRPCSTICGSGTEYCIGGVYGGCDARTPTGELCNGIDDDCDTVADEGNPGGGATCGTDVGVCTFGVETCLGGAIVCAGGVSPTAEICNGLDDDCDGTADDGDPGGGVVCGTSTGECTAGLTRCTGGSLICFGEVGPSPELCDGLDNDCDGTPDDGNPEGGMACGFDVGVCDPGVLTCVSGSLVCLGETPPGVEVCNGLDDDCDGTADDGNPGGGAACGPVLLDGIGICEAGVEQCLGGAIVCVGAMSPATEICNGVDDDCDGVNDDGDPGGGGSCGTGTGECVAGVEHCIGGVIACTGAVGPRAEICDGLDNDCDGTADDGDPGGGASCGLDVGECSPGVVHCIGGVLVCDGGVVPTAELCNGLDDDCDGLVDDGNPEGGAPCGPVTLDGIGICEAGVTTCVTTGPGAASLVCLGSVEPGTEECNGLDDDCNTLVDDGIATGAPCGTDVGECVAGVENCIAGSWVCVGEVGPVPEVCDGLDNNCDGVADEGNPGGGLVCGTDIGECEPGITYCDTTLAPPVIVCMGEVGPTTEVCNGLDDDCNHLVDDGLPLGDACGTDVGECEEGEWVCIDGELVCSYGRGPTDEVCNGLDDDCDTIADNEAECPGDSICIEGYCASPCDPLEEWPCPSGKVCEEVEGYDGTYCVGDPCEDVVCGPDERCHGGECVNLCDLITCPPGQVCVIEDGVAICIPADCYAEGYECPDGERCMGGECVEDPCWDVVCPSGEFCREGECHPVCGADIECPEGTVCHDGECVEDPCWGVECTSGRVCIDGECTDDPCAGVRCRPPLICVDGECVDDPCSYIDCPDGFVCVGDTCVDGSTLPEPEPDADMDGSTGGEPLDIAATGTGGCAGCTMASGGGGETWLLLLVAGLLGIAAFFRRRPARRAPLLIAAAATGILLLAGCSTQPYCLENCDGTDGDAGTDADDDGASDVSIDTAGEAEAVEDPPDPDACNPEDEELCNGFDDDCDTLIDEDFDLSSDLNNCGACGNTCDLPHAYPSCVDGTCVIDPERGCDVNYLDCVEDDPSDSETMGCETYCIRTRDDDAYCDGYDNDCDCEIDEDVDLLTDPDNCGVCGLRCRYTNGIPGCRSDTGLPGDAECTLAGCVTGYHDIDLDPANGCEYECSPCERTLGACETAMTCCTDTGGETCNLMDDDCEGTIDDGDPESGGHCGTDTGECVAGVEHCVSGALECVGETGHVFETCNGLDDDCDGSSDEPDPGETMLSDEGVMCGLSMGDCERGTTVCISGALDCRDDVEPAAEICDGHDNDCNGLIDDGTIPGMGGVCGSSIGECSTGIMNCVGGTPVCTGEVEAVAETCNGLDDDCNGAVDNDVPGAGSACGTDVGECVSGTLSCESASMVCLGEVPAVAETCDGLDNDCDGTADDGDPEGGAACGTTTGECASGVEHCVGGSIDCVGEVGPTSETCDGLDNDCNGLVDDGSIPGIGVACGTDTGECTAGTTTCLSGATVCAGEIRASTEVCDGLDNDCDGATDNGDPGGGGACGTDTGECTAGILHCTGGTIVCAGEVPATVEVCDGLDNDCDGTADNGDPGGGGACGTSTGECTAGVLHCTASTLVCTGETGPTPEICDGLDNDCDGGTDEGDPGGGVRCGTDIGECAYGTSACISGVLECPDDVEPAAEVCNGLDDDCNATVDDSPAAPGWSCDPDGVCGGTTPTCDGSSGWNCHYPPGYQSAETWCDLLDNDCDGLTDEGCPSFPGTDVWLDANVLNTISHTVATNGISAVHVAYLDRRNAPAADIYYRRSADGGLTWPSADVRLDTDAAGAAASVSPVLSAGWGAYATAAWADFRGHSTYRDVYTNFSDSNGASWASPDERVDDGLNRDCFGIDMAMDGSGGVYVVFEYAEANRSRRIYVARSTDGGASFFPPQRIDGNPGPIPQISSDPHVAVDGAGVVYVVWRDNRGGTGDIYFHRSTDSGATWPGGDVRLDSGSGYSDRPRIAADASGSVHVVWEDDRNGSVDIYTASSQNFGATFGADVQLDTDVFDHDSLNPSIAAVNPGRAWIVWEDYRDGLADIHLSLTTDAGVTWLPTDMKVNADPAGTSGATRPDVAAESGMVYVAWEDDRNGALDIYLNFSMDWGATFQPVDLKVDADTAGAYDSQEPRLETTAGRLHVVWLDYRNVEHYNGDIYYRLFM